MRPARHSLLWFNGPWMADSAFESVSRIAAAAAKSKKSKKDEATAAAGDEILTPVRLLKF